MKKYCIYNIWNGGTPFIIHTFDNIFSAKLKLQEIIEIEELRNRPYYVDNDFWVNKYPPGVKRKYFCIKCRDITNWEKVFENENKTSNLNNVYYFHLDKRG